MLHRRSVTVHIAALAWLLITALTIAAEPALRIESGDKFIPTFAVKYGGADGWPALEDAARFDLLVMGAGTSRNEAHPAIPGNTWQVLKALNPRLVMLLYEIGPGEYNTASWGRIGQGWDWITANHGPGSADRWTAVGLKSGQCLQGKAYGNERLMIPGNAAWQQYWLDNVYTKYWGDPARPTAIADGIFSDNTLYAMPYLGGWYHEGHPDTPDVPADYYSGDRYNAVLYHQHMKSFFARAFPWLAGKMLKIGLNFGDMVRRPQDWEELDGEPDAPLAAMEEGAFVHPWGGKGSFVFRSEEEWLSQIRVMRGLNHVRALMNVHGPVAGDAKGIDRMDARDATGNRAWDVLWYAMTSFLQGINDERSNACMNFTVWRYGEFYWLKEFDPRYLHLGHVRGEFRRIEGRQGHVYLREFDNGWAVVNSTPQSAVGIALPEGTARIVDHDTLERPEARPLVGEFDLPAHRGVVLLKAGRAIGSSNRPSASVERFADEQSVPPLTTIARLEETNFQAVLQAIMRLQEQLGSNQIVLGQNEKEIQAAAARNTEVLSNGVHKMENAVIAQQEAFSAQSARELEALQNSDRVMLIGAGIFAAIALSAMLMTAYFQWRMSKVLVEIPKILPISPGLERGSLGRAEGTRGQRLFHRGLVEDPNLRFLGAIEQLEKRIQGLEQSAKTVLKHGGS